MIDEKPPIGAEEVAEATAILQKYKAGKCRAGQTHCGQRAVVPDGTLEELPESHDGG